MILTEYINHNAELKDMNGYLIVSGYVSNVTDAYLEVCNPDDLIPLQSCGMLVRLTVFNSELPTLIGNVYLSAGDCIRVANLLRFEDFEKRSFFRVDTFMEAAILYKKVDRYGNETEQRERAVLINASLSGLRFHCVRQFEAEDKVKVELELFGRMIQFPVVVRRASSLKDRREYGCEIEGAGSREMDFLSRFLFKKQREQIQHYQKAVR